MRGVFRSGPKFLAIISSLNARRFSLRTKVPGDISQVNCAAFSVRTEIPGGISQFKFEALLGQDQNSWRYSPVQMRGVCRSEPKSLEIFPSFNARCVSVRTKIPSSISSFNARRFSVRTNIPGNIYRCECEALFSQNPSSWQVLPV